MKKYKLTLLKDLPNFPAGTEILNITEGMLAGAERCNDKNVGIFHLRDKPEWTKLEEDPRCDCQTKAHHEILYSVIGYGREIHSYIDFEEKKISTYYDYACDQGKNYSVEIKHCPFCGKEL